MEGMTVPTAKRPRPQEEEEDLFSSSPEDMADSSASSDDL